jgi:hypothetical protein
MVKPLCRSIQNANLVYMLAYLVLKDYLKDYHTNFRMYSVIDLWPPSNVIII